MGGALPIGNPPKATMFKYFAALLLFVVGHANAVGPFVPLPYDYYETAGRVKVQQPINNLTLPGGKRLFDEAPVTPDGGLPPFNQTGNVKNPSGNNLPITVTGRVPGASIGKLIVPAVKLLPCLSGGVVSTVACAGIAIYELTKEVGVTPVSAGDGVVTYQKPDPAVCTVSPCYNYYASETKWGVFSTQVAACQIGGLAWRRSEVPGVTWAYVGVNLATRQCQLTANGSPWNFLLGQISVAPSPVVYVPSSEQELQDAIAAKSGWPSSSAVAQAMKDAAGLTGKKVEGVTPTVSGPATSPGTTTVTNNTTNNTTNTQTTTHNHTYAGDTVTTTTTVTNITVDNSTGATTYNETTNSTPAPPAEQPQTCGLPNTPACAIDETGMPTATSLDADKLKKTHKDIDDLVNNPTGLLPTLPTVNWAFTLPTGCAVIPLPAFAPFVSQLDVCQFQPMFHDVMSVVWLLGAIFGAISLFMRNALSH